MHKQGFHTQNMSALDPLTARWAQSALDPADSGSPGVSRRAGEYSPSAALSEPSLAPPVPSFQAIGI